MSYHGWRPYVPVAQRRREAAKKLATFKKKGQSVSPVTIEGRAIAKSFWGQSWCANLERYSDYENRLPRGRTYVRNGSVFDLQIAKSKVSAMVIGSDFYTVTITIAPVTAKRWKAICRDCAGSIDSLVELLQGRLSKGVMDRVCREDDGLFPAPKEIKLSCSCPDWADMCKHVAAALYGVGARLDEKPALLFKLRGVDENQLLANAGKELSLKKAAPATTKVLDDGDVAALFGIEIVEDVNADTPTPPKHPQQRKTSGGLETRAGKRAVAYQEGQPKARKPAKNPGHRTHRGQASNEEKSAKRYLNPVMSQYCWKQERPDARADRSGYRSGRLRTAQDVIEFAAPQIQ
jgi:uncharacterized Zn finger protein